MIRRDTRLPDLADGNLTVLEHMLFPLRHHGRWMASSPLGWERTQGQEDTHRAGQSEQLQRTALGLTRNISLWPDFQSLEWPQLGWLLAMGRVLFQLDHTFSTFFGGEGRVHE